MINQKEVQILTTLCDYAEGKRYIKVDELAERFNVSVRTIRYDLEKIDYFLRLNGYHSLKRTKGVGLCLAEDEDSIHQIRNTLCHIEEDSYALSKSERALYIRLILFLSCKPIRYEDLAEKLFVSRKTIIEDVRSIRENYLNNDFPIDSTKNGICYSCSEYLRRKNVTDAILMMFSPVELWEIGMGIFPNKSIIVERAWYNIIRNDKSCALESLLLNLEEEQHIQLTDEQFYTLVLLTVIAYNRSSNCHNLDGDGLPKCSPFDLLSTYFARIESATGWTLSVHEQNYVCYELNRIFSHHEQDRILMISESIAELLMTKVSSTLSREYYKDNVLRTSLRDHLIGAIRKCGKQYYEHTNVMQEICNNNRSLYECIFNILNEYKGYSFGENTKAEAGLLTLHFCASEERTALQRRIYKALIVCSSGIGTSKILAATVEKHFPQIRVINTASVHNLHTVIAQKHPDFVLTTVPVSCQNIPVVRVNAVMKVEDFDQIRNLLLVGNTAFAGNGQYKLINDIFELIRDTCAIQDPSKLRRGLHNLLGTEECTGQCSIYSMLNVETIQVGIKADTWMEAIRFSAQPLIDQGRIEARYVDAMIHNIEELGPYIVILPGIAMPHSIASDGVNSNCMSLSILQNPVSFGNTPNDPVRMILCLGTTDEQSHMKALSELVTLLSNGQITEAIYSAPNARAVMEILQ